jgi:hypothetical protein
VNVSAGAIISANFSWLRVARTFGMISQKSRRMKVMTTTSMMNERMGLLLRSKSLELIKAARIMIAMLMMLLATRIVLSSLSGFASSSHGSCRSLPLRC